MSRIICPPRTVYEPLELDAELRIAVSQILYGCVPHAADGECAMIFMESPEKVAAAADAKEISTRFYAVEKEEFPSVAMDIRVTTGADLRMKYEYFFLTESFEESRFLAELARLGTYRLVFLCEGACRALSVEMTGAEIADLRKALPPG